MKSTQNGFGAAIAALLAVTVGCSVLHKKCHDEPVPVVGIVDVGGRVHDPRSIELGPSGLTLYRALLTVGGARDVVIAQTDATVDQENTANLQTLMEASRSHGILEVHIELFMHDAMNSTELAKVATSRTRQEVDAELQRIEALIDSRKAVLFRSLSIADVKQFDEQGRLIGFNEEQLRLFEKLPDFFAGTPREAIQKEFDKATDIQRKLFLSLNKSSARTWQQSVRGELLVALDRPSAVPPVRYYFPYDFAISGLAGEIELRDGDAVEVVEIQNTELASHSAQFMDALRDIAIQGAVRTPGVINNMQTIGDVHRTNPPTVDDPRGVWTLVRPSESGKGQKIFVLPDRMVTINGAAANAPTQDGDIYTYTILPHVPIVLESLVVRTLSGVRSRHVDRLDVVEKHRKKKVDRALARQTFPEAAMMQQNLLPTP